MPVGEMLARMSSYELGEWRAYFMLEVERTKRADLELKARAGVRSRKGKRTAPRRRR